MANSVVNSKFKPFSYSEMLAPMAAYTEVYNQNEQALGNIALESSVWEKLGENPIDAPTYKRYKDFQTQTEQQIDNLAKNGLTQDVRRNLMNVQQNYGKTIMPIKQAYEARSKQMEEQQKASLADKSLIFDRTADKTSLEDYIKNPVLAYKGVSRDQVTQNVAAAMQNYKGQLRSSGKWSTTAGGQMLQKIEQFGLAPEDMTEIIDHPDRYPEIQKLLKDTVDATGVQNFTDPEAKAQVLAAAQKGLWAGIGKTDVKEAQNQMFMNPYEQLQMQRLKSDMDNDAEALRLKAEAAKTKYDGRSAQTLSSFSQTSEAKDVKDLLSKLDDPKFNIKDTKQGNISINSSPWQTGPNEGVLNLNDTSQFKYTNKKYETLLQSAGINPNQSNKEIKNQLLKYDNEQTKKYNNIKIPLTSETKNIYIDTLIEGVPAGFDDIDDILEMDGNTVTNDRLNMSDLRDWKKDPSKFDGLVYSDWVNEGKGGYILKMDGKNYYVKPTIFSQETPKILATNSAVMKQLEKAIEDPGITEEERTKLIIAHGKTYDAFISQAVGDLTAYKPKSREVN